MAATIEDFMETATEEQKEVLFRLTETAEEETKHADEVNKIYKSIKTGVYSSDGAITVCEDADDAMIISAGPKQDLQRVRDKMKEHMEKAVELGMGHLGLIQRNYEHYVGKPLPKG